MEGRKAASKPGTKYTGTNVRSTFFSETDNGQRPGHLRVSADGRNLNGDRPVQPTGRKLNEGWAFPKTVRPEPP